MRVYGLPQFSGRLFEDALPVGISFGLRYTIILMCSNAAKVDFNKLIVVNGIMLCKGKREHATET